ncbi:MAG: hypothetical protein ACOYXY_14475 [Thermodesulfobacteriota bacterium]
MKTIITITASLLAVATLCGLAFAAGVQQPAGAQPAQTPAVAPITSAQSPTGANANAVIPPAAAAAAEPAPTTGAQVQQPVQAAQATGNPASASPEPSNKMGPGCPPCPPCFAQTPAAAPATESGVKPAAVSTKAPAAPTQAAIPPAVAKPAPVATGGGATAQVTPQQAQSEPTKAHCGPGGLAQGMDCGPSKSAGKEQTMTTVKPAAAADARSAGVQPASGGKTATPVAPSTTAGAQSAVDPKSQTTSAHVPPPGQQDCACCDREPVKSTQQEKGTSPVTSAPAPTSPPAVSPVTAKPAANTTVKPAMNPSVNPAPSGQAVQAQPVKGATPAGQTPGAWKQVPAAQGGPVQAQPPATQTQAAPGTK